MEPLPGEVGSPTDYTFEQTALQGGFFVSGEQVTLDPEGLSNVLPVGRLKYWLFDCDDTVREKRG